MFSKLIDYDTGWIGFELALKAKDIDTLIYNLQLLKADPSQHFHISSDFAGETGVADIEIYVDEESSENMTLLSLPVQPTR